ncbi:hypothetical protein MRX96_045576, partial [Rhipicephalus microplus]
DEGEKASRRTNTPEATAGKPTPAALIGRFDVVEGKDGEVETGDDRVFQAYDHLPFWKGPQGS